MTAAIAGPSNLIFGGGLAAEPAIDCWGSLGGVSLLRWCAIRVVHGAESGILRGVALLVTVVEAGRGVLRVCPSSSSNLGLARSS